VLLGGRWSERVAWNKIEEASDLFNGRGWGITADLADLLSRPARHSEMLLSVSILDCAKLFRSSRE
jgi:hypothetical protein